MPTNLPSFSSRFSSRSLRPVLPVVPGAVSGSARSGREYSPPSLPTSLIQCLHTKDKPLVRVIFQESLEQCLPRQTALGESLNVKTSGGQAVTRRVSKGIHGIHGESEQLVVENPPRSFGLTLLLCAACLKNNGSSTLKMSKNIVRNKIENK